jgi:glutamyl-Q tRNA(Asp) synthetase
VRIEDLDRQRCLPGSAEEILKTLESLGLLWDGEILYQSQRTEAYAHALAQLQARGLTFECSCSRRELHEAAPYPGTCRAGSARPGPTATRFRVDPVHLGFDDRLQGAQHQDLASLGDVIIRRRDGAFAYQLAVVVDDAAQGVTDVVRGADLLESAAWQIALQHALGLPSPRYMHVPLVVEGMQGKLSKSRGSLALERAQPGAQLVRALCLLRFQPPAELVDAPASTVLEWAIPHWPPAALLGVRQVAVPVPTWQTPAPSLDAIPAPSTRVSPLKGR